MIVISENKLIVMMWNLQIILLMSMKKPCQF